MFFLVPVSEHQENPRGLRFELLASALQFYLATQPVPKTVVGEGETVVGEGEKCPGMWVGN